MTMSIIQSLARAKMAAEQDKFRDWLKSQPPEEVLNHAYEYTIREDILMAMEELELTDTQAQALLESPSPLADVYRYFEKLETGYMDVIRDSIESRASKRRKWQKKNCWMHSLHVIKAKYSLSISGLPGVAVAGRLSKNMSR